MFLIKIVTMIIGALLIVLIGEFVRQKYKKKYNRVLNLFSLLKNLKNKMNFNKAFVKDIIKSNLSETDEEFNSVFMKYLETNKLNITWFENDENKLIEDFFNSLGENCLEIEMEKFEIIFQTINEMILKYQKILNTNGSVAYKLSICCSLLFLIMFA